MSILICTVCKYMDRICEKRADTQGANGTTSSTCCLTLCVFVCVHVCVCVVYMCVHYFGRQFVSKLQKENMTLKADKTKLLQSLTDQLLTANHRIEQLDLEKVQAQQQVELLRVCVYVPTYFFCSSACTCAFTYSVYM